MTPCLIVTDHFCLLEWCSPETVIVITVVVGSVPVVVVSPFKGFSDL